jgi:hypothetical protein
MERHEILETVLEELKVLLEEPDVDDAEYVLKEVYRIMGIDTPTFLDPPIERGGITGP